MGTINMHTPPPGTKKKTLIDKVEFSPTFFNISAADRLQTKHFKPPKPPKPLFDKVAFSPTFFNISAADRRSTKPLKAPKPPKPLMPLRPLRA